jgi:hypothetical protein
MTPNPLQAALVATLAASAMPVLAQSTGPHRGPAMAAQMKRLGKVYEPYIYDGAGHGFLRAQTGREART